MKTLAAIVLGVASLALFLGYRRPAESVTRATHEVEIKTLDPVVNQRLKRWPGAVVHHTASPRDRTTYADVRRWHVEERGWRAVGYHMLITADGVIHESPRIKNGWPGAHCLTRNDWLGIALTGDFTNEEPSPAQRATLSSLLGHRFPGLTVVTHGEVAQTACPGPALQRLVDEIREGE